MMAGAIVPPAPEHVRPRAGAHAHRTSSRARSASQNSIRSRALLRSRPVSCSTRRIR